MNFLAFDVPPEVLTVTSTLPDIPEGTFTFIWVSDQDEYSVAFLVPNVTYEVPWFAPKFSPLIVRVEPIVPEVGSMAVIVGAGNSMNLAR